MDAAAQASADRHWPHVPAALLAHLARTGQFPLPGQAARPGELTPGDVIRVREGRGAQFTWTYAGCDGQPSQDEDAPYILFRCTGCRTRMYQANTDTGISAGMSIARRHPQWCCDQRRAEYEATGTESLWPDTLDG